MARPPSSHPTDGELEILRVLWQRGPSSLGEICTELRRERKVATTTVATMLSVMIDKGLVRRKPAGRGHRWSAAVTHAAAARSLVGKLLDNVFDGSAGQLVAHLVAGGKLSGSDLEEIRSLVAENEKDRKSSRKRKSKRK